MLLPQQKEHRYSSGNEALSYFDVLQGRVVDRYPERTGGSGSEFSVSASCTDKFAIRCDSAGRHNQGTC